MDRKTFNRILAEEGIDIISLQDQIWNSRPSGNLDESKLREAAKQFKARLPDLLVRQALNEALDREYNKGGD